MKGDFWMSRGKLRKNIISQKNAIKKVKVKRGCKLVIKVNLNELNVTGIHYAGGPKKSLFEQT